MGEYLSENATGVPADAYDDQFSRRPAPTSDAVNWFGAPPVGAPGEAPPTAPPINVARPPAAVDTQLHVDWRNSGGWNTGNLDQPRAGDLDVGKTLIAAAVRCCVPPGDGDQHTATCPAYGYPPPPATTPRGRCHGDAGGWRCGRPDGHPGECDPSTIIREDQSPCGPTCKCELCEAEALADVPVGPALVSWQDLADFAASADDRFYSDADNRLYCLDHNHADQAFAWPHLEQHRGHAVALLLSWLARHWACDYSGHDGRDHAAR